MNKRTIAAFRRSMKIQAENRGRHFKSRKAEAEYVSIFVDNTEVGVVFGVYPDDQEPDGVGVRVLKETAPGTSFLIDAVPCTKEVARAMALGDDDDDE